MIEKLVIQKLTVAGKEYEYPDTTALVGKINELVDAVNAIQIEREAERFEIQEWIGILETVRKSVNIHEKQIDELQMKVEPQKCEPTEHADELDRTKKQLEIALDALRTVRRYTAINQFEPKSREAHIVAKKALDKIKVKLFCVDARDARTALEQITALEQKD